MPGDDLLAVGGDLEDRGEADVASAIRQRAVAAIEVERMDLEGFGSCSNEAECEAVCPKEISIASIARMNRQYLKAAVK